MTTVSLNPGAAHLTDWRAILDGAALTTLRTPALSAVAVDALAAPEASRLVVVGSGPQALGHVHALRAVRPIADVRIVARSAARVDALIECLAAEGVSATAATGAWRRRDNE